MNKNRSCATSTLSIVVAFIVFWPLGIVFLVMRLSEDKKNRQIHQNHSQRTINQSFVNTPVQNYTSNTTQTSYSPSFTSATNIKSVEQSRMFKKVQVSITLLVLAITLASLGLLILIGEELIMGLIFIAAGVVLFVLYRGKKKQSIIHEKYINIVALQGETEINCISEAAGLEPSIVRRDLEKLIKKNVFDGAYIDNKTNEIILPGQKSIARISKEQRQQDQELYRTSQTIVVTCPNCAAKVKCIAGKVTQCSYCDSYVSA